MICYKNVGIDSDLVSELWYQVYFMGAFRAPGEDYELYKQEEGFNFSLDFDLSFD